MRTLILVLLLTALVVPFAYGEVYSNVVGLYKIQLINGRNLVSLPFLPFSTAIDDVVGDQLTGHSAVRSLSDTIEAWDPVNQKYLRAWYNTTLGQWQDWDGGAPLFNLDPDQSYWFNRVLSHPDVTITVLGEVSETNREIEIGLNRNMVAPSFPKEMALGDSGLPESGFTGHVAVRSLSDTIEWWNNTTRKYDRVWYRTSDSQWIDWDTAAPTTRTIKPGEGMWIMNLAALGRVPYTWVCPKPY